MKSGAADAKHEKVYISFEYNRPVDVDPASQQRRVPSWSSFLWVTSDKTQVKSTIVG